MNTTALGPPLGLNSHQLYLEIDSRIRQGCSSTLQRALERADYWISAYQGKPFLVYCTRSSRVAETLVQGAGVIAQQLQSLIGNCYLGIYCQDDCVFFKAYVDITMQTYQQTGGPMFQRLLDHFARRQAARQRSEGYQLQCRIQELQQEQEMFWEERSRLLDRLIVGSRAFEDLLQENTWLRQRLDVALAELDGKNSVRQEAQS